MRRARGIHRALAATLILAAGAGLAACAPDPVAEQYREGSNKGYIAADFSVLEIPAGERAEPVAFAGVTESGDELTSDDVAGEVVVLNFWYAGCGPCRAEAANLEEVWQDVQAEEVSFIGVNTYDQAATATSFAETYGVTYPSIIDVDDKRVVQAFAAAAPIQATPTTLVLDKQGRVAARILGPLKETSILETLVRDALAENP